MLKIYPYKNGSESAKALARALGVLVLKKSMNRVFYKPQTVINWGSSQIERDHHNWKIINHPAAVANAANKLATFNCFRGGEVPTVEWTQEKHKAIEWLENRNDVVVRHKLSGHSGEGIEIITVDDYKAAGILNIVQAPLYTKYVKKKDEYRIHVFNGEVIFQQRKARKKDVPDDEVNWQVRNLAGGFIFANDGIVAPDCVLDAAVRAVRALGLDFGAADIGFKDNCAVVYEVNTACGLAGKTLDAYVKAFESFK